LDRAHGRAPGLESSHPPDLQHHPIHVRRVFAKKIVLIEEDHRLEISLGGLGLAITRDTLIRNDTDRRIPADHGTPETGYLERRPPRARSCAALLSRKRSGGRRSRERSEKSPSRPIHHDVLLRLSRIQSTPLATDGRSAREIVCSGRHSFLPLPGWTRV